MNLQTQTPPTSERPVEYVADISFDDMGLSPELRRAVAERGYTHPTPVQAKAFQPAVSGRDLIVRSKTGTGKTTAFGLPIVERIPMGTRAVKALVMCPTRELALQVSMELESLAKHRDIRVTAIYGGASMKQQEDALHAGSAIIVGTPGRVFDHIRRGNLKLETASIAVLDEADEMLNQGFYEEVTRILDCFPQNRQVLLFSATVPEDIQRLISKYTKDPETLLLSGDVYTVDHIQHVRYDISDAFPKPRNLLYMLELENPDNAIIFCNTRDDTELVTAVLNRNGFDAELLNGDLPQKERERVMAKIKRGEVALMVATDLAARGIDISDLGHVINYSLPEDPAVYLHRVGRTGRIGKKGVALNLVSGRELASLTALERKYSIKFEKRAMPSAEDAMKMWTERHVAELKDAAQGAIFEGFLGLAAQLKSRPDADELIAFMLRSFFTHRRMEKAKSSGDERPSASERREPKGGGRGDRKRDDREERPRRERSERGDRGERSARGDRGDRGGERRERREGEAPAAAASAAATADTTTQTPASATSQGSGARRLSDRELFQLMQSGQPLPPMEDPTVGGGSPSGATSGPPSSSESGERRARREREPRRRSTPTQAELEPGQARVWLNLGKMDGIDDTKLREALSSLGAPVAKIQKTELRGSYSYLLVQDEDVASFESLAGKQHGDKVLKLERARRTV